VNDTTRCMVCLARVVRKGGAALPFPFCTATAGAAVQDGLPEFHRAKGSAHCEPINQTAAPAVFSGGSWD
jgi:hypothetical protein